MRALRLLVSLSALVPAGCGNRADKDAAATIATGSPRVPAATSSCPPGSPKLAVTGLCQAQAAALLPRPDGTTPRAAEGCSWTVNATAMPAGAAILYRAATCRGRVTTLDFVPGARAATMAYTVLAPVEPGADAPARAAVVTLLAPGAGDPRARILEEARRTTPDRAEAAQCRIKPNVRVAGPPDALVVDVEPVPRDVDGIRSACGPFGLDEGSQTFWRVSQGRAWFFQLGQETPAIDPGSITLVHHGKGSWVRN